MSKNPSRKLAARAARLIHHSSESNEWFTPPWILTRVHKLFGHIDLDPASCYEANQHVGARRYFTEVDDGLTRSWKATTVFLNCPYGRRNGGKSNKLLWSTKMVDSYMRGEFFEGVLIVTASVGDVWWSKLFARWPSGLFRRRVQFVPPRARKKKSGQAGGSSIFYFGEWYKDFERLFSDVAFCTFRGDL
jgi:phage N-6-adenine-methyltransferase